MRRTFVKSTFLSIALLGLVGAAQAEWVAFNDYIANSTQTSANATTNDMRVAGGPYTLKSITDGSTIPDVTMWVTVTGGSQNMGNIGGSPRANSPLYNVFNGYCYFEPNNIQVAVTQMVTVTFSNLNPAKVYKLHAGAIRGDATRTDRWTKCNILGADGVTPNHQQATDSPYGMLTTNNTSGLLSDYEVAFNSGVNLCGDMVEWDNIYPGADGSFSFTSTQWQYANAVASHGTNTGTFTPNSTSYGYAIAAFRLEEMLPPNSPPKITVQPLSQTNAIGGTVTFNINLTGTTPFKFQWRKNGTAILNATNQSFSISNLVSGDAANYSVAVTNTYGNTISSNAVLGVVNDLPLNIVTQPQSQAVSLGQPVTFSVEVTGSNPRYQWLKNNGAIANATNASYTIQAVSAGDAGTYSVRITNRVSIANSDSASLIALTGGQALFIARTNLSAADLAVSNLLVSKGLAVQVADDRSVNTNMAIGKALVVISASVDPANIDIYYWISATNPLISFNSESWGKINLCVNTPADHGTFTNQMGINIVDSTWALADGLSGVTQVYTNGQDVSWGNPGGNAFVVAVATNSAGVEFPVIFGYERKARMPNNALSTFNGRRVGLFLGNNGATALTTAGANLVKAAVSWAVSAPVTVGKVGISRQPVSVTVPEGFPAGFSVNATGALSYTYQWQCNGTNITNNGTARSYIVNSPSPADNQSKFRVIVKQTVVGSPAAYATSSWATLTVQLPPPVAITQQPGSIMVGNGQSARFTVQVTGGAPYFQWYYNGLAIEGATSNTYSIANVSSSDVGNYYVVVTNRVNSVTSQTAQLGLYPENIYLLGWGTNTWKYYTNATDLGSGWVTNGYTDTTWPVGSGIFVGGNAISNVPGGYTAGTIIPLTNSTGGKIVTWYFRNSFNFTNNPDEVTIDGSSFIDDGAVYYLNGKEVSRENMPTSFAFDTWASSSVGNVSLRNFSIDPSQLRQGNNTFAVEVHQGSVGSGDMMMGVQLALNFIRPSALAITNQPSSLAIEEGSDATFTVGVSGSGAKYQWYKAGTAIAGATRSSYTITNTVITNSADYYVTVSNFFNYIVSSNAHLMVLTNTSLPALVSADGTATNTMVLVTFTEPVRAITATNAGNYIISNITTKARITVTSAVLTNNNQVLLKSGARTDYANYVLVVNNVTDTGSLTNKIAVNSMIPITCIGNPITWNQEWVFLDPNWSPDCMFCDPDSILDQGTVWRTTDFVVPSYYPTNFWPTNIGVFNKGEIEIAPALGTPLQGTKAMTAYFRKYFNAYPIGNGKPQFRYVVASGAVFYLNGQEFYRFHMPNGTINYQTAASWPVPTAQVTDWIDMPDAGIAAMKSGTNLMAVELHQTSTDGDSRRAFGMELRVQYSSLAFGPILITSQPTNTTVFEGQAATFKCVNVGAGTYQWSTNGVAVDGATNDTFTIATTTLAMNNVQCSVALSNATNRVTSSQATLTVLADNRAPQVVSASVGTNKTISINFSRSLDPLSATNPALYTVSCSSVVSARLTNGTNVILTTLSQPTTDCVVEVGSIWGPGSTNGVACGTKVTLAVPSVVTVADTELPVISGCPGNITTNKAVVTWTALTAVDNCSGTVPVVCTPPSASPFDPGATDVRCIATDAAGNEAECTFTVTVTSDRPTLQITQDSTKITVTWTSSSSYKLYTRANLGTAPLPSKVSDLTWDLYTGTVTTNNSVATAIFNKPTQGNLFFMLK